MTLSDTRISQALGKSSNKSIAIYQSLEKIQLEETQLLNAKSYIENLRENVKRTIERKAKHATQEINESKTTLKP